MRKKIVFSIYCSLSFLLTANFSTLYAYNDEITHPEITKKAEESSKLDYYLSENLGRTFLKGSDTAIKGKPILEWLTESSKLEDESLCRASNHFHDPLKTNWSDAGLSDPDLRSQLIPEWCKKVKGYSNDSNLVWATRFTSPTLGGSAIYSKNQWDWYFARSYYSYALTASDKASREAYFAKAFQPLGQIMHIMQDIV